MVAVQADFRVLVRRGKLTLFFLSSHTIPLGCSEMVTLKTRPWVSVKRLFFLDLLLNGVQANQTDAPSQHANACRTCQDMRPWHISLRGFGSLAMVLPFKLLVIEVVK